MLIWVENSQPEIVIDICSQGIIRAFGTHLYQ